MTLPLPIKALGTEFLVEIWDELSSTTLETVNDHLEFLLSEFEQKYSRFKTDSYISILNNQKFIDNPPPDLVTILQIGISYFDRTAGVHNLMVGETLISQGYDADYSFIPKRTVFTIPDPHKALIIGPEQIILREGMIDIGGYGKGVAIDLLATTLTREFGLRYFLINGGGDVYGTSNHGKPITLYLEHPTEPDTYLGTTTILNQGFAASSRYKRSWTHNKTHYSHIIDTTTDQPVSQQNIDASFITAPTATTADVFATVALLAPPNAMSEFASANHLGVATFALPSSLIYNQAFVFNHL